MDSKARGDRIAQAAGVRRVRAPVAFQLARQIEAPAQGDRLGTGCGSSLDSRGGRASGWRATASSTCVWTRPLRRRAVAGEAEEGQPAPEGKIIVEHTNINPNKAAHIGHLRNAVLGDTSCACCGRAAAGSSAELHRQHRRPGGGCGGGLPALAGRSPAEVAKLASKARASTILLDLYRGRPLTTTRNRPPRLRQETLHAIEAGQGAAAEMAHIVPTPSSRPT